jgi:putative copper resistance protein D
VLDAAVVVLRLLQYGGAMILFGSSLFFIYALPREGPGSAAATPWAPRLVAGGGALLAAAALLSLPVHAGVLAGAPSEAFNPETLSAVVSGMGLGRAAAVRALAAVLATVLLLGLNPTRRVWIAVALLGGVAVASLPWMGHGAASEGSAGRLHLASDVLHSWAAAVWIGALVPFLLLLRAPQRTAAEAAALHRALHGFSGVGSLLVAVLVLTGVVNGTFLVGPDRIEGLWTTPYGRLLSLKILLFVGMLGLAAANRYRLTPAFGRALEAQSDPARAVAGLRRSVMLEMCVGLAVLGLVACFGTLAPPAAG